MAEFPNRYNAHLRSESFAFRCEGESATHQEFEDECDINSIMRKYIQRGQLPSNIKVGRYGDFAEVGDYKECLTILDTARQQFKSMPSEVRRRFDNDPVKFLDFVQDKGNREEARKLGLLKEEPPVPPVVTPPAPPKAP